MFLRIINIEMLPLYF